MKIRKNAASIARTRGRNGHSYDYDLSALVDHMNYYVLTLIVADLAKPDGAHRQYNEEEVIGLALFLRDALPSGLTPPAVPRGAPMLAFPA